MQHDNKNTHQSYMRPSPLLNHCTQSFCLFWLRAVQFINCLPFKWKLAFSSYFVCWVLFPAALLHHVFYEIVQSVQNSVRPSRVFFFFPVCVHGLNPVKQTALFVMWIFFCASEIHDTHCCFLSAWASQLLWEFFWLVTRQHFTVIDFSYKAFFFGEVLVGCSD